MVRCTARYRLQLGCACLLPVDRVTRSGEIIGPAAGLLGALEDGSKIWLLTIDKLKFPAIAMIAVYGLMLLAQLVHFIVTPSHKPKQFFSQRIGAAESPD